MNRTGKNVIVLGYVQSNMPWLSDCGVDVQKWAKCTHPGICVEIWRTLIPFLGYTDVRLKQSSSYGYKNQRGRWNGLMGMLQRGEVDATLAAVAIDEERFSDFAFGTPINQLQFGFVIGQPIADESERSLQVQVFAQWVFILLGALTIILGFLTSLQLGNMKMGFWRAFSSSMMQQRSTRGLHTPFIVLGYTILIAIYFSGFKSQAITWTGISEVKQVPMKNMEYQLRTRESQLVIEDISQLPQPILRDIVRSTTNEDVNATAVFDLLIEPDQRKIAELLCRSSRTVYYGTIHSLLDANPDKRKCFLTEMRVDNIRVSYFAPLSFAFRRNFVEKTLRAINARLLRVFTEGHAEGFLGSRYRMNDWRRQTSHGAVGPIKLKQLSTGFLVWLCGVGLSLLSFSIVKLRQELFAIRIATRSRTMRQALSRKLSTYSC